MASEDSFPTLKVLLIGPSGAGKSACEFSFFPFFFLLLLFVLFPPTPALFMYSRLVSEEEEGEEGREGDRESRLVAYWSTGRPTDRPTD